MCCAEWHHGALDQSFIQASVHLHELMKENSRSPLVMFRVNSIGKEVHCCRLIELIEVKPGMRAENIECHRCIERHGTMG